MLASLIDTATPPEARLAVHLRAVASEPRRLDPVRAGDHLDRLYRAARALTGSAHEAEDIVQETYARVLSRPRLVDADKEFAYLMRALRNVVIDGHRRGRAEPECLDELPVEPASRTTRGQPEAEFAAREVYDAIAALPTPARETIAAIDIAGLSYREAAVMFGVPEGTVMSRLFRARSKLAAQVA